MNNKLREGTMYFRKEIQTFGSCDPVPEELLGEEERGAIGSRASHSRRLHSPWAESPHAGRPYHMTMCQAGGLGMTSLTEHHRGNRLPS